ncbi:MAG: methyltransferase domain-containing protein [Gammaproteobacteria bacterium]|nr:methyltransferase domain-containing protein [Gammaproteobacteria bacterium]
MSVEALGDDALAQAIRSGQRAGQALVDEYYRRCIPIYLDFIGVHWHTGFYRDDGKPVRPADQVRMIHHIADSISLAANERVLDVGCGIGGTPACLARDYQVEAVGLTPVREQRRVAARIVARAGAAASARIDLGHAGTLPYSDGCFDAVVFFESPCHFPDRLAFFEEAFRVLKPGGRIAGEDWLATGVVRDDDSRLLEPVHRSWAIPALGTGHEYLEHLAAAGFQAGEYVDMQTEMRLEKGFAVSPAQQRSLSEEIESCRHPLLALTLEGLLALGRAVAAGAFTVGRFRARKPAAAA